MSRRTTGEVYGSGKFEIYEWIKWGPPEAERERERAEREASIELLFVKANKTKLNGSWPFI